MKPVKKVKKERKGRKKIESERGTARDTVQYMENERDEENDFSRVLV